MTIKQAIVIRADLAMSPGKIAAQAVHAANQLLLEQMSTEHDVVPVFLVDELTKKIGPTYQKEVVFKTMMFDPNSVWHKWTSEVTTCVVLSAPTLEEIYELRDKAAAMDIPFSILNDNYHEVCKVCLGSGEQYSGLRSSPCINCSGTGLTEGWQITCIAIGPAEEEVLDKITGGLEKL